MAEGAYGAPTIAFHGEHREARDIIEAIGARRIDGPADLTVGVFDDEAFEADVLIVAPHQIDLAVALHPDAELLCDPSPPELAAALALALLGRGHRLADPAREADLRQLSEEAARVARALAALADRESHAVRDRSPAYRGEPAADPSLDTVRQHIRARRLRARFFDAELFADPAWDMLLDLFAARLAGEPVAVSSLCIAAQVPPTTALRWIRALTEQGLFVRNPDPADKRRVYIALADTTARSMASWFAALGSD